MSKILLIEDDADIQENLRLFLEMENYVVESAMDGQEGFQKLKAGLKPDVILLDLMMPVMNGYEFLTQFRKYPEEPYASIPIIILSAATDLEKIARDQAARFVRKPIDLDLLLNTIQELIGN